MEGAENKSELGNSRKFSSSLYYPAETTDSKENSTKTVPKTVRKQYENSTEIALKVHRKGTKRKNRNYSAASSFALARAGTMCGKMFSDPIS